MPNETHFSCGRRVARGVPAPKAPPLQIPVTPEDVSCKCLLGDTPHDRDTTAPSRCRGRGPTPLAGVVSPERVLSAIRAVQVLSLEVAVVMGALPVVSAIVAQDYPGHIPARNLRPLLRSLD